MYIFEIILLSYFGYVSLYSFILSTAGLFYKTPNPPEARRLRKVAVLIPAYKEDQVITGVAEQPIFEGADDAVDRFTSLFADGGRKEVDDHATVKTG